MFKESDIRFESAKVTDIYLLQETLKKFTVNLLGVIRYFGQKLLGKMLVSI